MAKPGILLGIGHPIVITGAVGSTVVFTVKQNDVVSSFPVVIVSNHLLVRNVARLRLLLLSLPSFAALINTYPLLRPIVPVCRSCVSRRG